MSRSARKRAPETKSKISRSLKAKISRNESKKVKKDRKTFGYKIPQNSR